MLQTHHTPSVKIRPKSSKTGRHSTNGLKDYLLDHLECALLLADQRGLQLTSYLVMLSIESLKDSPAQPER
jgi:hypothetical protein